MNTKHQNGAAALAARRTALVAQCAQQRIEAAQDFNALVAPLSSGGGLRDYLGGSLKVPLTIAGVVLGMIVTKPARALPVLTAGFSLWKLARTALSLLRRPQEQA